MKQRERPGQKARRKIEGGGFFFIICASIPVEFTTKVDTARIQVPDVVRSENKSCVATIRKTAVHRDKARDYFMFCRPVRLAF